MSDDYTYLAENGECGSVLVVLAQCFPEMLDLGQIYHLSGSSGTEAAVDFLLVHGFISDSFVPREGHPRQRRRMYYITSLGLQVVAQLIA